MVDISSDGNTVGSTDSQVLRIATASGTMGRALVTNRAIPYIRISSAGDKVYFINRTGSASTSDPTTERGLYVINADGAPLDDRFVDGWTTSDVAATDPGGADGAGGA